MYDFHTHSTHSDGTLTPTQLVDYAIEQGINRLALTDHDSINGVAECMAYGLSKGLQVIPGLELSINWHHKVIHVVALNVDLSSNRLISLLESQQNMRTERAKLIGKQLFETIGLVDGYDKARHLASEGLVARPHFAQVLINEGFCKDMKTAFSQYLKRGKCGYVRTNWVDLEVGIKVLVDAGGIPILAHPKKYQFTRTKLHELLNDFKRCGGKAMEVISGLQSRDEIQYLVALCNQFDLLGSCGSDFHGVDLTPKVMLRLSNQIEGCKALMDSPLMEKYL